MELSALLQQSAQERYMRAVCQFNWDKWLASGWLACDCVCAHVFLLQHCHKSDSEASFDKTILKAIVSTQYSFLLNTFKEGQSCIV